MRSLYFYILSILGLAVSFSGLLNLLDFCVQLLFSTGEAPASSLTLFSESISAMLVGVPLWLVPWLDVQSEAAQKNKMGDQARRSLLRKSYLYLVLFLLVVGVMVFGGQLLFTLLDSALSQQIPPDLWESLVKLLAWLVVDCGLLIFHFRVVRIDNQIALLSMGDLHANFPTLILSETKSPLNDLLMQEIQRIAPRMPVATHLIELGAPDDVMLGAKAVLIPFSLAIDPPESLRLWFNEYHGPRLLVPSVKEGYIWLGQSGRKNHDLAREAARAVRQMSEGEMPRQSPPNSPWSIIGYILGGLFGLQLLGLLFGLMISILFR